MLRTIAKSAFMVMFDTLPELARFATFGVVHQRR
jgi:hypothetical protein